MRFMSIKLARDVGRVLYGNTVEPSVSYHPKCKDLVVTYERWSLTRNRITGVSSEKMSGHIYFTEDNLVHAISKPRYVQFHVITKVLPIF